MTFPTTLKDLIEYPKSGIFSKILFKDRNSQYSLFCLAAKTAIEEHTSTRNAVITIIEGTGNLNLEGQDIALAPGVFVLMGANAPHALQAQENLAFVLALSAKSIYLGNEKLKSDNLPNNQQISQKTIDIVKSTAPTLKKYGTKITSRMYEIMFSRYPEVKSQFDMSAQANGKQPTRLANAVYAYATHIDDLEALKSAVDKIAHRHVATHVLPEQYPIVGECLLQAIKDVMKDDATEEVMIAWTEAYQALAKIFIDREQQIYSDVAV